MPSSVILMLDGFRSLMRDVLFVGGFDPVDQLLNDGHRFVERQRPSEGMSSGPTS
jgi:hypothetical protein